MERTDYFSGSVSCFGYNAIDLLSIILWSDLHNPEQIGWISNSLQASLLRNKLHPSIIYKEQACWLFTNLLQFLGFGSFLGFPLSRFPGPQFTFPINPVLHFRRGEIPSKPIIQVWEHTLATSYLFMKAERHFD